MDEKLEKAFAVANYMATLSNQKRVIKEEFSQKLMYYINGGSFKISPELISFVKCVLDTGHTKDITLIDSNQMPILIPNTSEFLNTIVSVYFEAVNEYATKLSDIKSKRKLSDIVEL